MKTPMDCDKLMMPDVTKPTPNTVVTASYINRSKPSSGRMADALTRAKDG